MNSKRELLFFIENYTGGHVDIKEMSHPKKHARTYMNRFTINEDDQYEISKIEEMDSDWGSKEGPRPEHIQSRIQEVIRGIKTETLDVFLFGWYEFEGTTRKHKNEMKHLSIRPYTRRINIYTTLNKERFHLNRADGSVMN